SRASRSTLTPRPRRQPSVEPQSAPGEKLLMLARPSPRALKSAARCEIDLSPGTRTLPRTEAAGGTARSAPGGAAAEALMGEAVGASRRRCQGHRLHQVAMARTVAGIGDDRQVAHALDERDGAEIERVAGGRLERADAAFAQDHVWVAGVHDVFGGHEPFFNGRRQSALEHGRLSGTADFPE